MHPRIILVHTPNNVFLKGDTTCPLLHRPELYVESRSDVPPHVAARGQQLTAPQHKRQLHGVVPTKANRAEAPDQVKSASHEFHRLCVLDFYMFGHISGADKCYYMSIGYKPPR